MKQFKNKQNYFAILEEALDPQALIHWVQSPAAGAINTFIGTVRNQSHRKEVIALDFECYEEMALKTLVKLGNQAREKWPLLKIAIHHRTGRLELGEVAVIISLSSPHRKEGFEACEYLIDTLKELVPIWKKEIFKDGEVWVSAHP